jgi:hypothetical protein
MYLYDLQCILNGRNEARGRILDDSYQVLRLVALALQQSNQHGIVLVKITARNSELSVWWQDASVIERITGI